MGNALARRPPARTSLFPMDLWPTIHNAWTRHTAAYVVGGALLLDLQAESVRLSG
jgi:hypothetical protein